MVYNVVWGGALTILFSRRDDDEPNLSGPPTLTQKRADVTGGENQ